MRIRARHAVVIGVLGTLAAATVAVLPSAAGVLSGNLREAVSAAMLTERGAQARAAYGVRSLAAPRVEKKRVGSDGDWSFGAVVIPVPGTGEAAEAGPEAALYVARRTLTGWQVGLEGSRRFAALAEQAPSGVVSGAEKKLFSSILPGVDLPIPDLPLLPGQPSPSDSTTPTPTDSATPSPGDSGSPSPTGSASPDPSDSPSDTPSPTGTGSPTPTDSPGPSDSPSPTDSPDPSGSASPTASPTGSPTPSPTSTTRPGKKTGLMLPFKVGAEWWMGGGPHGPGGHDRPFNALDFNGGDGRVLAAAPGKVYRFCSESNSLGLIRVVHGNGYATDYYHMRDTIRAEDGTSVKRGNYLGHIGSELPCGGSSSGDHVHFGLRKNGKPAAIDGLMIGGWTFHEGERAYRGYAERDGVRVERGDRVTNYGPS